MLVLIIGGSGSGKSAYAEDYITKLSKDCRKYYIATMQVYDEEGQKKVFKHQKMRDGKGFNHWQSADIHQAADKKERIPP